VWNGGYFVLGWNLTYRAGVRHEIGGLPLCVLIGLWNSQNWHRWKFQHISTSHIVILLFLRTGSCTVSSFHPFYSLDVQSMWNLQQKSHATWTATQKLMSLSLSALHKLFSTFSKFTYYFSQV